jgi:acyl-CoA thioesterase-2
VPFDLKNLLTCLELEQPEPATFVGQNLDLDYRRVFGGQILGQTVRALNASASGKSLKSLTQLFPREGDTSQPMSYAVTAHQDGRTFGTYGVVASQGGKTVSVATASLHVEEDGLHRQDDAPDVGQPGDSPQVDLGMVPWEVRVVDGVDLNNSSAVAPAFRFWTKAPPLPSDTALHQALLAHATDLTLIGTALLPVEGMSQAGTGTVFHSAVTSHSLWFHQPFRLDEWLLVDQHSPVLSQGRAFGRGDVWAADGRLVASFAQEAMVRMLPAL